MTPAVVAPKQGPEVHRSKAKVEIKQNTPMELVSDWKTELEMRIKD